MCSNANTDWKSTHEQHKLTGNAENKDGTQKTTFVVFVKYCLDFMLKMKHGFDLFLLVLLKLVEIDKLVQSI